MELFFLCRAFRTTGGGRTYTQSWVLDRATLTPRKSGRPPAAGGLVLRTGRPTLPSAPALLPWQHMDYGCTALIGSGGIALQPKRFLPCCGHDSSRRASSRSRSPRSGIRPVAMTSAALSAKQIQQHALFWAESFFASSRVPDAERKGGMSSKPPGVSQHKLQQLLELRAPLMKADQGRWIASAIRMSRLRYFSASAGSYSCRFPEL